LNDKGPTGTATNTLTTFQIRQIAKDAIPSQKLRRQMLFSISYAPNPTAFEKGLLEKGRLTGMQDIPVEEASQQSTAIVCLLIAFASEGRGG
jgi:hypothetical protein